MRQSERGCHHSEGRWLPLVSMADFEALPWCPRCGPVEALTSGWLGLDEEPTVLFCKGCHEPLVALE
jgi:hypothetical protein